MSFDCQINPMISPIGRELTSPWLQRDLEKARKENKAIILFVDNMYQNPHPTPVQKNEFNNLVARYKIAAIFSGLEPDQEEEFFYDNNHVTKFYNTGVAIPRYGNFILLENRGHSLDVSIYNTHNGGAILSKKMSSITLPH
ncbi:hypothetical protein AYJ09_05350 [Candidatus Liberibacter solanacearum]|uniref:hypothetical protein n=1 Tax=Candidatus Liberibacter solanacearum TaxID=556287 RepID=UPI000978E0FB|nr:hypothetical protein [Candidatus Liberibacter solanacearum]ONI58576.1 hypothetical protein AYJ09_05350 [Candidatus Liberibacter solanacearum]